MTSVEAILVTLMPTLNMFLSTTITLEAAIENNLNHYLVNVTIIFGIHSDFTDDSEAYGIACLFILLFLNLNRLVYHSN